MSLRRVLKRDGREVPFDKGTIAAAVGRAQNAVGQHDPIFAAEVAELVELALRRRYAWRAAPGSGVAAQLFEAGERDEQAPETLEDETTAAESVPGIEEIQDLVEVGLIELGRAKVAKAYILYRDRRTRARDSYVHSQASDDSQVRGLGVEVRESEGTFPWSKGRIAAALVHEADLSRKQAEEVAGRVEARVISSGLKRLSTGLIREFVDSELVSMGLAGALARQAPVSLPRYDLRELLESGSDSPVARRSRLGRHYAPGPQQAIAGEVLSRYALADVFDDEIVLRHLSGALHIEDLRAPHLHLSAAVGCDLLQRGEPSSAGTFAALDEIAQLFGAVSKGLVLENPAGLLAPLTRGQRGERGALLANWLLALSSLGRAAARRVDLAGFGAKSEPLLTKLMVELDRISAGELQPCLPRLFVERERLASVLEQDPALGAVVERLLTGGKLLPTWAPRGERCLGPAGRRRTSERGGLACAGALSLNLARIAQQAGPWREDLVLEGIAQLLEQGVLALSQLAQFQRTVRAARPGEVRGRVAYALVPVGLREALRHLGDGELRAEQGSRLLGLISDASRRYAAQRGLCVFLSDHHGGEARARFALCDGSTLRQRQGLLFDSTAADEQAAAARTRPYSGGFELGHTPGQAAGVAQAQLLATVPVGSWRAIELDRQPGPTQDSQLDAFQRFERERKTIGCSAAAPRDLPQPIPFFSKEAPSADAPSNAI